MVIVHFLMKQCNKIMIAIYFVVNWFKIGQLSGVLATIPILSIARNINPFKGCGNNALLAEFSKGIVGAGIGQNLWKFVFCTGNRTVDSRGSKGSYQGARGLWEPAKNKVFSVLKVHRRAWPKDRGPSSGVNPGARTGSRRP